MGDAVRVHARWDDADRFGHVNNSAYLALIRDATDRIAPEPRELATIDIEFKRPVPPNQVPAAHGIVVLTSDDGIAWTESWRLLPRL